MLFLLFALGAFVFGGGMITITNILVNRHTPTDNSHSKR
jgi:hypothetical protein